MQRDINPTLTAKQQHWFDLIKQAEASTLSLSDFAKANNVELQQLYQYRYALRKKGLLPSIDKKPRFDKVEFASSAGPIGIQPDPLTLHFPNGLRLTFSSSIDRQLLGAIIEKGLGLHAAPR